ncbi:MAG: hypothetical protein Q9167_005255 [Letrouitia subvulpina]
MPILALPKDTVRAISSSQVLTDSASVVKELIDNALDARATSISVEIAANALDLIQVKDNGCGIAPEDRQLVCRRYYTSKINDLDDLANLGGRYLGFRGEALASLAEMSENLVVCTRIDGDATAASFKVSRLGEVEKEEPVSYPVGTTIRVKNFLKFLPVRRQASLKDTNKLLNEVKKRLQTYSMARPSVRFSLKILKAKNEKGNWTYAPKPNASVTDAATKMFGKRLSDQCQWLLWTQASNRRPVESSEVGGMIRSASLEGPYQLEALLPRANCDLAAVCHIGQFISVDSRPVSSSKGTIKQIFTLFKSYFRSSLTPMGEKIKDPFLFLNIICPAGSYDANIEPSKNDVLFINPTLILKTVETAFENVYGKLQTEPSPKSKYLNKTSKPQIFDIMLARKPQPDAQIAARATQNTEDVPLQCGAPAEVDNQEISQGDRSLVPRMLDPDQFRSQPNSHEQPNKISDNNAKKVPPPQLEAADGIWRTNTCDDYNEDVQRNLQPNLSHHRNDQQSEEDEEQALRDIKISNPWTYAKLNATTRSFRREPEADVAAVGSGHLFPPARYNVDLENASSQRDGDLPLERDSSLPSPMHSQISERHNSASPEPFPFPYPMTRRRKTDDSGLLNSRRHSSEEYSNSSLLDTWVQKTLDRRRESTEESSPVESDLGFANRRSVEYISTQTLPNNIPLSTVPKAPSRPSLRPSPQTLNQSSANKPFVSPVRDPNKVWFDTGSQDHQRRGSNSNTHSLTRASLDTANIPNLREFSEDAGNPIINSSPPRPHHPDLARSLDYETRKAAAVQQARKEHSRQRQARLMFDSSPSSTQAKTMITSSQAASSSSPHQNRYRKAVAALQSHDHAEAQEQVTVDPKDPRAYLIRSLRDAKDGAASTPSKRRKSTMLPLENFSEKGVVRDLTQVVRTAEGESPNGGFEDELWGKVEIYRKWDRYINGGVVEEDDLSANVEERVTRLWEEVVRDLVRGKYGREGAQEGAIEIDVWGALQRERLEDC